MSCLFCTFLLLLGLSLVNFPQHFGAQTREFTALAVMETEKQEEIEKYRRSLTASKSMLTRSQQRLDTLLADPTPDLFALENGLVEFQKRLDSFDSTQAHLEMCVPDGNLESCITEAANFRDTKLPALLKAQKLVADLNKSDTAQSVSARSVSDSQQLHVKGYHNWTYPNLMVMSFINKLSGTSFKHLSEKWTCHWS